MCVCYVLFSHRQSFQEWKRERKHNFWPRPPTGWDSKLKQQKEEIIGGHVEVPQPPSVTLRAHNAQGCDPRRRSALYMWSWIILGIECMEVLALCWLNIVVSRGQSRLWPRQRPANRYSRWYLPRALSVISNDLGFILLCSFLIFYLKQYFL